MTPHNSKSKTLEVVSGDSLDFPQEPFRLTLSNTFFVPFKKIHNKNKNIADLTASSVKTL